MRLTAVQTSSSPSQPPTRSASVEPAAQQSFLIGNFQATTLRDLKDILESLMDPNGSILTLRDLLNKLMDNQLALGKMNALIAGKFSDAVMQENCESYLINNIRESLYKKVESMIQDLLEKLPPLNIYDRVLGSELLPQLHISNHSWRNEKKIDADAVNLMSQLQAALQKLSSENSIQKDLIVEEIANLVSTLTSRFKQSHGDVLTIGSVLCASLSDRLSRLIVDGQLTCSDNMIRFILALYHSGVIDTTFFKHVFPPVDMVLWQLLPRNSWVRSKREQWTPPANSGLTVDEKTRWGALIGLSDGTP